MNKNHIDIAIAGSLGQANNQVAYQDKIGQSQKNTNQRNYVIGSELDNFLHSFKTDPTPVPQKQEQPKKDSQPNMGMNMINKLFGK